MPKHIWIDPYIFVFSVPIEADQSGHHCVEEAESKYWWLHRSVKPSAPTVDPVMVPYRFTGTVTTSI